MKVVYAPRRSNLHQSTCSSKYPDVWNGEGILHEYILISYWTGRFANGYNFLSDIRHLDLRIFTPITHHLKKGTQFTIIENKDG